jgi:hypothetical protein
MAFLLSYYAVQSVSIAEYKGGELANIQKGFTTPTRLLPWKHSPLHFFVAMYDVM